MQEHTTLKTRSSNGYRYFYFHKLWFDNLQEYQKFITVQQFKFATIKYFPFNNGRLRFCTQPIITVFINCLSQWTDDDN